VGVPGHTKSDVVVCEGVPAAVAVLGEAGSVEHATRGFVDRFDVRDGSLASCPHEVELIATGQADRATVPLEGLDVSLVAVVDRDDRRMVLFTIPARHTGEIAPVSPLLDAPLDESPAIIWLKDLDGRYLRVNHGYVSQLGTDAERVCGRTDAELTAANSIEGLRLEDKDIAGRDDPLELEYLIGAFEERPAFNALRFALRDGDGRPTATCSVAAPVADAALARSECDRLMRIDRWGRLDGFAIRQELLDEWELTLADGSAGPPLDRDDRLAATLVERDEALATVARLEEELLEGREQRDSLRSESERAGRRAAELDGALEAEHARGDELEQSLVRAEARVDELDAELTAVREELEEHRQPVPVPEATASVPDGNGVTWDSDSQRALSAALVGLTEWRAVLKQAVATLGSQGGWDAAVAWSTEKPRGSMRCCAFWMCAPGGLATFETQTWQYVENQATAEFGRACSRMATTCLLDLQSAEDPLLKGAASVGIGSALLVPVSDGGETIAMLELLSRTDTAPDPELMISLDAIALQLGAVARLLTLANVPRWRVGRI